jgi:hypothetical protein
MGSDETAFFAAPERGMRITFVAESILVSMGAFAGYMYMPGTKNSQLLSWLYSL